MLQERTTQIRILMDARTGNRKGKKPIMLLHDRKMGITKRSIRSKDDGGSLD
jgi:hypothetical protein